MQMFSNVRIRHIVTKESDHCFVLEDLRENLTSTTPRGHKPFRYEDIWQTHVDYDKLVLDSWQKGAGQAGLQGIAQALSSLQGTLAAWGAREFG